MTVITAFLILLLILAIIVFWRLRVIQKQLSKNIRTTQQQINNRMIRLGIGQELELLRKDFEDNNEGDQTVKGEGWEETVKDNRMKEGKEETRSEKVEGQIEEGLMEEGDNETRSEKVEGEIEDS